MPIIEKTDVIEDDKPNEVVRVAHFVEALGQPAHSVREVCKSYYPTKVCPCPVYEYRLGTSHCEWCVVVVGYYARQAQHATSLGFPCPRSHTPVDDRRLGIVWRGLDYCIN